MYYYFPKPNGQYRVLCTEPYAFYDMTKQEVYKLNYRYALFKGYEMTDEGIKQFGEDFRAWCTELYKNNSLCIDYKKYYRHESAVELTFKRLCKGQYEDHEQIGKTENKWIDACFNAGLTFCDPGTYDSYGYDFSSYYPRLLAYGNLMIPTKPGKEKILLKLKKRSKLKTGYYRVKITCTDNNFKKIFAFSPRHIYTHSSLQQAIKYKKQFNVTIALFQDGKPNAYIYKDKYLVSCNDIFRNWFDKLYAIKEAFPKNKLIKHLTSSVWGHITTRTKLYKTDKQLESSDLDWGISNKRDWIIDRLEDGDGVKFYTLLSTNTPYKYQLRIKAFLMALARNKIAEIALLDIDNTIRIHTDNVTFKVDPDLNIPNLLKEDKSSGLINWKSVNSYTHID